MSILSMMQRWIEIERLHWDDDDVGTIKSTLAGRTRVELEMKLIEYLPNLNSKSIFKASNDIIKLKSLSENLVESRLDLSQYSRIHCSTCHAFICLNNFVIKNAPSEYWHDLLDCWACHDEDYNSRLKGHKNGKILAKKGILLLFDSKIVLEQSDLTLDSVNSDTLIQHNLKSSDTFHDARYVMEATILDCKIQCRNCQKVIGSFKDEVVLNLYSIIFQNDDELYYKPWIYYFGKQLLDSAIAYSTYKSQITSHDKTLLLWVIQWDVWINTVSNDESINVPLFPALKVLYKEMGKDELQNDKSVEIRSIDSEHYTELIGALDSSFPFDIKVSNGFKIGFLRL